jgi:hypothetical protein
VPGVWIAFDRVERAQRFDRESVAEPVRLRRIPIDGLAQLTPGDLKQADAHALWN